MRISLRHNSLQQTSGEIYALKRMTIVSFVGVVRRYSAFRRSRAYQRMPMCSARARCISCGYPWTPKPRSVTRRWIHGRMNHATP